jgi:hypothetical protein
VLVDLAGNELPALPAPFAATILEDRQNPPTVDDPVHLTAATHPADEQTPPPAAVMPASPPRRARPLWLLSLAVLGAAAAVALPRLGRRDAESAVQIAATRPTAVVQFDLGGGASQLFLDGAPLAANPIALATGEFHTVTAVAGGQVVGTEKFLVDRAKTVRVRVGRR